MLDRLADALDAFVPQVLRITGAPGLSLAVEHRGETLERAYGWADLAARRPMSTSTLFPGGSMTKLYTAVAILQLVEEGIVGLHDPVNSLLDDVDCTNPLGARAVSVYDLLTFRSGLGVDTTACSLHDPPPLDEHVRGRLSSLRGQEYAGHVPRWTARVGERYQYANLGISILGLIAERHSQAGASLADHFSRRILEPLGMQWSFLSDFAGGRPDGLSTGYACFRDLRIPTPWLRSADHPANGLMTTPGEHVRLLSALRRRGGGLLAPESVTRMLTPQVSMSADISPGGWWTGLVAILGNLGLPDRHFGQPGAHEWGWWNVSRAYPALDAALSVSTNGWDMMRWHNPANPEAAVLVTEHVAAFLQHGVGADTGWARRRAHLAGVILAERTHGLLGVPGPLPSELVREIAARTVSTSGFDGEAFQAGLRLAGRQPVTPAAAADLLAGNADQALLLDLGGVYGFPAPLWVWGEADEAVASWPEPSAASTARAMAS
jgi:CubicO group peptidase (beta-lactamase class C family)